MAHPVWTDERRGKAKTRKYARDWRGRFGSGTGHRVMPVKRLRIRKVKLNKRNSTRYAEAAMAIRALPPEWDKITGVNAKSDGLKLWKRKQTGEFPSNKEFYAAADKYHRTWRKAHPGNNNYASKNMVANAAYRHEYEATGEVQYLSWSTEDASRTAERQGAGLKGAKLVPKTPKPPVPKKTVDKTKTGIGMVEKAPPPAKKIPDSRKNGMQLRAERDIAQKAYSDGMDKLYLSGKPLTAKQLDYYENEVKPQIERVFKLDALLAKVKPDRSRYLKDAKTLTELQDIWNNRNPGVVIWGDWQKQIDKYKDEHSKWYNLSDQELTVKSLRSSLEGIDSMLEKYPKLKIHNVDLTDYAQLDKSDINVAASYSQSMTPMVHISLHHACFVKNALSMMRDDPQGFHPPNFGDSAFQSVTIHEMGHGVDWQGNQNPKLAALKPAQLEANMERTGKEVRQIITDVYNQENPNRKVLYNRVWDANGQLLVNPAKPNSRSEPDASLFVIWLRDSKNMSGYSWRRPTKEHPDIKYRTEIEYTEFLAEAFADTEINGPKASNLSQAIHKYMVDGLNSHHPPPRRSAPGPSHDVSGPHALAAAVKDKTGTVIWTGPKVDYPTSSKKFNESIDFDWQMETFDQNKAYLREGAQDAQKHGYKGLTGTEAKSFWAKAQSIPAEVIGPPEDAYIDDHINDDAKDALRIEGKELVARAVHSEPTDYKLYRGSSVDPAEIEKHRAGYEFSLPLSSFTENWMEAELHSGVPNDWQDWHSVDKAEGGKPVVFELEPGAKVADVGGLVPDAAHESVAFGKFEVVEVEPAHGDTPTKIHIRQKSMIE